MKFYQNEENEIIFTEEELYYREIIPIFEFNEKHTPVVQIDGENLKINVNHVMNEEHFIKELIYVTENHQEIIPLKDETTVTIPYQGSGTVYSNCNLHGIHALKI